MDDSIEFTGNEGSVDYNEGFGWESIKEADLSTEVANLTSKLGKVTKLLFRTVADNDYEACAQAFKDLWMNDLSVGGWVPTFCHLNKDPFGKLPENQRPSWWTQSTADMRKAYETSLRYYWDLNWLTDIFTDLSQCMMKFPLKDAFRFMRSVLNFDEAGFDREFYNKINQDMKDVAQLLRKSWDALESGASNSRRYYNDHFGKVARSDFDRPYVQARQRDYQLYVQSFRSGDSFQCRTDGTITASPYMLASAKVIDKYTRQISSMPNIEDAMKQTMETCRALLTRVNTGCPNVKGKGCQALADALSKFITELYEFSETAKSVWDRFKNRDPEEPFCFVTKLSAYSEMNGAYGLNPVSSDPWHDGTEFHALYLRAASALTDQCKDFVYRYGPLGVR